LEKTLVEARAVSLYPSDWAIIEQADTASAGVSATLRRIVREWHRMRLQRLVDRAPSYEVGKEAES